MNARPYIVESYPDRGAWIAARAVDGRVSASRVASLLGIVPGGLWREWCRMHEPHLLVETETTAAARGNAYEAGVLELWSRATERAVTPWDQCSVAVSSRFPWLSCTPDATSDGEPVEAKTSRFGGWPDSGTLDLSTVEADPTSGQRTDLARFVFQCIAQAIVLGSPRAHLAVAGPFIDDLHVYVIEVSPATVSAFVAAVLDARSALIAGHPPLDDSDLCAAWARQPRIPERPGVVDATDAQWSAALAWQAADAAAVAAGSRAQVARAALMESIAHVEGIRRGTGRVVWVAPKGKSYRYPKASGFDANQEIE